LAILIAAIAVISTSLVFRAEFLNGIGFRSASTTKMGGIPDAKLNRITDEFQTGGEGTFMLHQPVHLKATTWAPANPLPANIPTGAKVLPRPVALCTVNGVQFCIPLRAAGGNLDWASTAITEDLTSRFESHLEPEAKAAFILGGILLILAAAHFWVVLMPSRDERALEAGRQQRFIDSPPTNERPGAIRSFGNRLYSLMFEGRQER
jgi:hypothetical protein